MRAPVIFGGLALVFGAILVLVVQKEAVLARGQVLLLELAPVDPRSLMQGDYMTLDYDVSQKAGLEGGGMATAEGRLVLRRDEQGVGHFVRREQPGTTLAPGELWLRYKVRQYRTRLGAEAFFFQEGHADRYAQARYGELRVADDGTSVLVGLRDAERQPLGAPVP